MSRSTDLQRLIETLKLSVATLRDRGVPFVLGRSLAAGHAGAR